MKKAYIYIIGIVVIIITIIMGKYYNYKAKYAEIKEFNLQFEYYYQKEIYGTEIATVINKAVDNNEKNEVEKEQLEKDNKKIYSYIANDENSINVDIKMLDINKTYKMESLYQGEITKFVEKYNYILFKCTKIEYNTAGKVSYLLFEQISE